MKKQIQALSVIAAKVTKERHDQIQFPPTVLSSVYPISGPCCQLAGAIKTRGLCELPQDCTISKIHTEGKLHRSGFFNK